MKRRRRFRPACRIRHRWSDWAFEKRLYEDGYMEIDPESQFRMCRRCGHQELREVICG